MHDDTRGERVRQVVYKSKVHVAKRVVVAERKGSSSTFSSSSRWIPRRENRSSHPWCPLLEDIKSLLITFVERGTSTVSSYNTTVCLRGRIANLSKL